MKKHWLGWIGFSVALLSGCATQPTEEASDWAPVAAPAEAGEQRPVIMFPGYFLMDGYELHDHGHIPQTRLIGAGMSAKLDMAAVRQQFSDVLYSHQWTTDKMELGRQYFRIMASHDGETVEIRAVQGSSGPVQVFLLYTPSPK